MITKVSNYYPSLWPELKIEKGGQRVHNFYNYRRRQFLQLCLKWFNCSPKLFFKLIEDKATILNVDEKENVSFSTEKLSRGRKSMSVVK